MVALSAVGQEAAWVVVEEAPHTVAPAGTAVVVGTAVVAEVGTTVVSDTPAAMVMVGAVVMAEDLMAAPTEGF